MGTPMNNPYGIPQQRPEPDPWQGRAICAQSDPERWFPEQGGSTQLAKEICASCPVQVQCLEYAMENDLCDGIYGGLTAKDRRRLLRRAS